MAELNDSVSIIKSQAYALKTLAFDVYKKIHAPSALDVDNCLNYKANDENDCLSLESETPCPNCTTFQRLTQEFEAIPFG